MYQRMMYTILTIVTTLSLMAASVTAATPAIPTRQLVSTSTIMGQRDIIGPPDSDAFGQSVTVLPNGNIVVIDPLYDAAGVSDVGAVYLYDGRTGVQMSVLTGSTSDDMLAGGAVTVLPNGNYVIINPNWDNGTLLNAGAVTWGSGTSGISGTISAANSFVGSSDHRLVGIDGVIVLPNGNYIVPSIRSLTWGNGATGVAGTVGIGNSLISDAIESIQVLPNSNYLVLSPTWDNGDVTDAGAVTWGSGTSGITGIVGPANSLFGSSNYDQVGGGVTILPNGNYLVSSPIWDNGSIVNAGAVTWGNGTSGTNGIVNATNSLVGSSNNDMVGAVTLLANGNYVVDSPEWDNSGMTDVGAVTWGSSSSGVNGAITTANSLIGNSASDQVGLGGVTPLPNGHYVVDSPRWNTYRGAVTWGSGTGGITGTINANNSLVGSLVNDQIGFVDTFAKAITALPNGNYIVQSPYWDNGSIENAGAVTWGSGINGLTGSISTDNSLVGSLANDQVGTGVTVLANGNYVVRSFYWHDNRGAVTWGNGMSGIVGVVSASNSLVGTSTGDYIALLTPLPNGNFIVIAPAWDQGAVADVGAVTWGDGTQGITGTINVANSLIGTSAGDRVGGYQAGASLITLLPNSNYLVRSIYWDSNTGTDVGAVTLGSGTHGITGAVDASNSLIGSYTGDSVGAGVDVLANGNYVVSSTSWQSNRGAFTWGSGTSGITGIVGSANSLVGGSAGDADYSSVTALPNGDYVVRNSRWDHGSAIDAGAVTWGSGLNGIAGTISSINSLVGSTAFDSIGSGPMGNEDVIALAGGNYLFWSAGWDNGTLVNAGAVTWGGPTIVGPITTENSVRGATPYRGQNLTFRFDNVNNQLVVGRPADQRVTLFGPNVPPNANAGSDQIVQSGASVTLDGSSSSDIDHRLPLTFIWTQLDGLPVVLHGANTDHPTFTAPIVVADKATLTFMLVVTDSFGRASTSDSVVVQVGANLPPTANAGANQTAQSGTLVTLDGNASSDQDGNLPLTFGWKQLDGLPVVLHEANTAHPTFIASAVVADTAILTFTLIVTDSLGLASTPTEVNVYIEPYQIMMPLIVH